MILGKPYRLVALMSTWLEEERLQPTIAMEEPGIRLGGISGGEVEEVPQNWVTLGSWRKWEVGTATVMQDPAQNEV